MLKYILSFYFLMIFTFSLNSVYAKDLTSRIQTFDWEGLEVVWLEDDRFPTYDMAIYFADGAIKDSKGLYGSTEMMFDMLTSGTIRYNQAQISDALEFYGVSLGTNITHEYSMLSFSGLTKDLVPTLKMVCHLFKDSTFPDIELQKKKKLIYSSLKNIALSPSELSNRVFRQLSLQGTPYEYPTDGTMTSLKNIKSEQLLKLSKYFKEKVKKRIYIAGPKAIKIAKRILIDECDFGIKTSSFVRESPEAVVKNKGGVFFIALPNANQAQVRIGRYLSKSMMGNDHLDEVVTGLLGGGFTSILMQELRVKRGLTYSASAFVVGQKDYGRVMINTFTKSETVPETLEVIKTTLENLSRGLEEGRYQRVIKFLKGRKLFDYERNSAFLGDLIKLDHQGRSYDEIIKYPEKLDNLNEKMVVDRIVQVFSWQDQIILITGNKDIIKNLQKKYKVNSIQYQKFL